MSANLKFFATILGLAVLIVGGVYLLKQYQGVNLPKTPGAQNQAAPKATDHPLRTSAGLPNLPATSSGKQVDDYVKVVQEDAKESSDLTVTNCKASPGVLKVKTGSKITIKNNDDKQVRLRIRAGAVPIIEAKKTLEFTLNIEPAIYSYGCDQTGGIDNPQAGVIYILGD